MHLTISIIIPVYNAEKYLNRCLDSIIHQKYKQLEIIIVNDGSTDDSGNICDNYAQKDSRIQVFHKKNEGVSKARNMALDIALGDYVHCVDADDWLEEDAYQTLIQELQKSENIDIIKFNAFNSQNIIIGTEPIAGVLEKVKLEEVSLQYIGSQKYGGAFILGVPWLYLIRRSLIQDNDIRFNEDLHRCEDRLFIITNFLYATKVLFIDLTLYHYETAGASLSNKYDKQRWEQEKMYLQELQNKYKAIKTRDFISEANLRINNDTVLRAIISINNVFFSSNSNTFIQNYKQVKKIIIDPFLINSFESLKKDNIDLKSNITVNLIKMKQAFLLTVFNTILLYKSKI